MEIPTGFPSQEFEQDFNSSQPFDCDRNTPGYNNFHSSFPSGGTASDAAAQTTDLFPKETSLSVFVSRISCLGQKAEKLQEFHQRQSELQVTVTEDYQQADSAISSILREVIVMGAAIVSKISSDLQRHENLRFTEGDEIVEMNEDEILVEHTHFCEICGKGFRRDANVRMHMRSHGDQYKTQEALMAVKRAKRSYSCPVEKCGRNRRHPKFRPLTSLSSLRNHYKRSHRPKMYSCNKCGKDFSVVSDLKFHERDCGKSRWRCSCGTTFCRKDKLFRHLTLFDGHKHILPFSAGNAASGINKGPMASAKNCNNLMNDSGTHNEAKDSLLGLEWNGMSQTDVYLENLINFSNDYLEEDLESSRVLWGDL